MNNIERLYEIIEEAARTNKSIQLDINEGDRLHLTMISNTKFLMEDLFWEKLE